MPMFTAECNFVYNLMVVALSLRFNGHFPGELGLAGA